MGKTLQNIGDTIGIIVLFAILIAGFAYLNPESIPAIISYIPSFNRESFTAGIAFDWRLVAIPIIVIPAVIMLSAKGKMLRESMRYRLTR